MKVEEEKDGGKRRSRSREKVGEKREDRGTRENLSWEPMATPKRGKRRGDRRDKPTNTMFKFQFIIN